MTAPPVRSVRAPRRMVACADHLATQAGMWAFARGGGAVDAAIAANAVMAVVAPHLCGIGGDLFALVHHDGEVHCLNASGRAGSGASAAALRDEGHTVVPFRHDVRAVTVPGCIDGWVALVDRFAVLSLAELLEPAIRLAEEGFPASPLLVGSAALVDDRGRRDLGVLLDQVHRPGSRVRREGVGRTLRTVGVHGRDGFYGGEFGEGLLRLGDGLFERADLVRSQADWVAPLRATAFGRDLWAVPPNSQGYLLLGAAALADRQGLAADPDSVEWVHVLVECAKAAGRDRPAVLHEAADGGALLAAIAGRSAEIGHRAAPPGGAGAGGDTTYLCTVDERGTGVSLIQSNASGFGSWLVEPTTGVNLHNRGLGFSLESGHPAELRPGARPPHTLSPALATTGGALDAVFGTMGGDAQPQILLQLAARLFAHDQSPTTSIHAGRWALQGDVTGFDTWTGPDGPAVAVEGHAPEEWAEGLAALGHRVRRLPAYDSAFGHAHAIVRDSEGWWAGAADPRAQVGSVAGD